MKTSNIIINAVSIFVGTSAITYICTGESLDWTAVRVWDQFYQDLNWIGDLEKDDANWNTWAERWAELTLKKDSTSDPKNLKSDYWKNKVIGTESKTALDASGQSGDEQKKTWAKKPEERSAILELVKKLQDECKWAYGRYINRAPNWDRSWFKSLSRRDPEQPNEDDKNYEYWKDVYTACQKSTSPTTLPVGWLSKENARLYSQWYNPPATK
ncbi:hypothetical protein [Candidatus Mycoplasma haematohominis]|uniref:Uncharacterized protein n=1 Tax=Candidatus Mycoplasma haematohominis TaxID=1494318 RepID=A0A478FQZ6_9MOLU|nr:hypothetical protein [Candidatus Mycoplasma haemohominis]GCE63394.1 hypothetical protein MHSWG343_03900 [Candidatus Mycoplasma haemohominis]